MMDTARLRASGEASWTTKKVSDRAQGGRNSLGRVRRASTKPEDAPYSVSSARVGPRPERDSAGRSDVTRSAGTRPDEDASPRSNVTTTPSPPRRPRLRPELPHTSRAAPRAATAQLAVRSTAYQTGHSQVAARLDHAVREHRRPGQDTSTTSTTSDDRPDSHQVRIRASAPTGVDPGTTA